MTHGKRVPVDEIYCIHYSHSRSLGLGYHYKLDSFNLNIGKEGRTNVQIFKACTS
ncbi:hypothetical protein GCM10008934_08230 [Virgibacillus salarius]